MVYERLVEHIHPLPHLVLALDGAHREPLRELRLRDRLVQGPSHPEEVACRAVALTVYDRTTVRIVIAGDREEHGRFAPLLTNLAHSLFCPIQEFVLYSL